MLLPDFHRQAFHFSFIPFRFFSSFPTFSVHLISLFSHVLYINVNSLSFLQVIFEKENHAKYHAKKESNRK